MVAVIKPTIISRPAKDLDVMHGALDLVDDPPLPVLMVFPSPLLVFC